MNRRICRVVCFLSLTFVVIGCGDDNIITTDAPSEIVLSATPSPAEAGETVTFTLQATAPGHTISATRIDFEGDGTWDRTHTHSSATASSELNHTFDIADSYLSRAEMMEGSDVLGSATAEVTVVEPGPRIALEIISMENPSVRAQRQSETWGTCSDTGTICQSNDDCSALEQCIRADVCIFEVEEWAVTFAAVPISSETSSPLDDIVMVSVDITYDWINAALDGLVPPQTIGLGNVTIPAGGQNGVTFAPIPSDPLNITTGTPPVSPFEGATSNLTLTFNAITGDGTHIELMAQRQLIIEICR